MLSQHRLFLYSVRRETLDSVAETVMSQQRLFISDKDAMAQLYRTHPEYLKYSYELRFKDNARILIISSPEESNEIWKQHDYYTFFPRLSKTHQGFIVIPYQYSFSGIGLSHSGGMIWDASCIEELEQIPGEAVPIYNPMKEDGYQTRIGMM